MDLIINLLEWLTPYGTHSHFLIFGILIACGFGLPLPEDVVLVTAGLLASRGIISVESSVVVTMAGVLLGDGAIFLMGRKMGAAIKNTKIFKKVLSPETDKKIHSVFEKYGDKVIFAARFMPGLRMPLFMSAGIYRVKPWKFFLLDGTAALISVPVWLYVGYVFGKNLELLEEKMSEATYGIYGFLLVLIIVGLCFWFVKKKIKAKNKILNLDS
jgi:membrane protein DedA with SNARE-associated domain